MAVRGLSANETARALISMMARSAKNSNQRPDTLMQDRTSANSMKVLLQRAAGPYIRVKLRSHGSKMARPVYLRQWTYLISVATAVECQNLTHAPQQGVSYSTASSTRSRNGSGILSRRALAVVSSVPRNVVRVVEVASAGECGVVKQSRNRFILTVTAAVVRLGRTGWIAYGARGKNPAIFRRGIRHPHRYLGACRGCFHPHLGGGADGRAPQDRLQHGADRRARPQRQVRSARSKDLGGGYQCQRRAARSSGQAHLL